MASYFRPAASQLGEALEALALGVAEGRPRVVVAGATDHYPARVGRAIDEDVLDVSGLAGLRTIDKVNGGWWIGAGTTWTDLVERPLPACFDGLKRAARAVGGLQVQNRGTLAGNVCNASPAADGIPNLMALQASVRLRSVRGERDVPVGEFVTGNRTTRREPDELVTGLVVPDPAAAGHGLVATSTFRKLGARAYLVISIAMVAAVVVRDAQGRITSARLAVGACSPVARRLPGLEAELAGRPLRPGVGGLVRAEHLAPLSPIDDVRGTAEYRRGAALVLVRRALEDLAT
ncbi:MAG: FAD binding domain-containing protein [Chloroflexota bacterium]